MSDTLCWNCNAAYPIDAAKCPNCQSHNANVNADAAQLERELAECRKLLSEAREYVDNYVPDAAAIPMLSRIDAAIAKEKKYLVADDCGGPAREIYKESDNGN